MAAGISRPDVWTGLALNRDPNDANTPPVWTTLESSRLQVEAVSEQVRGRDYELAQAMSSSPKIFIRDINEDLNPDNPSSPYAGDVQCYREVCQLAQWPITPVGAAVNLINSGTWRGSGVDAYDPTFESYTDGATAPNWLERAGISPAPTITTTNPFQGSKSATFAVVNGQGTGQGVRVGLPVIPGRQYTTSAYVRQSTANTMAAYLEGVTAIYDAFSRTSVSSLGTPNASWLAAAYTAVGGAAGDYAVSGGAGRITMASAAVIRLGELGAFLDSEQTITITAPALATGDSYVIGLVSRYVDANNYYRGFIEFRTDGTLGIIIERRLAAVNTFIADVDLPLAYAAGDKFILHFSTHGTVVNGWCWPISVSESQVFGTGAVVDSSAALQVPGGIGPMAYRFAANTNSNPVAAFEDYGATGSVAGTSTSTSGAYVRLSVTYTADQVGRPAVIDPAAFNSDDGRGLCFKIQSVGATSGATVNVDAIQHEQAAAASTFNASGPVVYPIFRLNMERYPRGWRARGFEGVMAAPCVDALAQLNRIAINAELTQAMLSLQPDYYYPLDSGGQNAVAPESSGRGGPALVPTVSSLGPGTALDGGTDMGIPGSPGSTGTQFTYVGPPGFQPGTILGTGYATPNPLPFGFPLVSGGKWAITVAMWTVLEPNAESFPAMISIDRYQTDTVQYTPLLLDTGGATLRNNVTGVGASFAIPVEDSQLHFVVAQVVQDAANTTVRTVVDGQEIENIFTTAAAGGFFPAGRADTISIGGRWYTIGAKVWKMVTGSIAQLGVWNRELSTGEIDTLYGAGQWTASILGYTADGELEGDRILRHIQSGAYAGPTRIAPGSSLLGPPNYTGSIDLSTDSLNSAQAGGGVLWVQPDGVVAYEGRTDRWLRLTPRYTIGENAAGGENPYLNQPLLDRDPTYVFPIVTWKRNNGATAIGGRAADRQAALRRFFPRRFDAGSDFWEDSQAQDAADFTFYGHRAPLTRTETVVFDPWANPALWPFVLSMEPGIRVTLVRRAKAANGGAGLTVSLDFFIEKITIPQIVYRQGEETWIYEVQLSPAGRVEAGGAATQPWILGDATWGVLDATTVLGW
jgi:hypothetical protein